MYTTRLHQISSKRTFGQKLLSLFLHSMVIVLVAISVGFLYLHRDGQKPFSVQSGSMAPSLQKGDLVIVSPVSEAQIANGDIVTFINPANRQQTITHRVVGVDHEHHLIQTRGDANASTDKPFRSKLLVGRVEHRVPLIGVAIDTIRTPLGLLLVIYLPCILIIIGEVRRLGQYYQSQKKYVVLGRRAETQKIQPLSTTKVGAGLGVVGIVLAMAAPAYAALFATTQLTSNTLATVTIPDSYQVCAFPDHEKLLSYSLIDVLYPEQPDPPLQLQTPIIPGTYKITAISNDGHLAHPNAPTQPNERWFVYLYGDTASDPLHATGVTNDIPDNADQTVTVVSPTVTFNETVTALRYAHNALLTGLEKAQFGDRIFDELSEEEKRQVIWNSVHPGCLTFERIRSPQLVTPPQIP